MKARRRDFPDPLFGLLGKRKTPLQREAVSSIFGGIASCWMPVSSVREIDYELVHVEFEGREGEVPVNVQTGQPGEGISWHDWKDWVDYVSEEIRQEMSLLVSPGQPDEGFKEKARNREESILSLSEGVWAWEYKYRDNLLRFDIFIHLPDSIGIEEAKSRVNFAKSEFEKAASRLSC